MHNKHFQQRHDPKNFVSSIRPYNYDPNAECPEWMRFLSFLTSEKLDLIKCIQLWCASIFCPQYRTECFLWLTGLGKNGKSVFVDVLTTVVGEQCVSHLSARQLAGKHELAGLADKKVNVSMEFEKVTPAFVDIVKNLCSNEPLTINEKMKSVYDARLFIRLLFVSNSVPYVTDRSDGFWRRCLLVECKGRVRDGEEDLSLSDKLKGEAPGIFNWLLEGVEELIQLKGKIPVPASIQRSVEKQRRVMDPHRGFLNEQIVFTGDDQWLPGQKEIYPRYRKWMTDRGQAGMYSWDRLKIYLKEVFPGSKSVRRRHRIHGRAYGYCGIAWKENEESKSEVEDVVEQIMSLPSSASSSDDRDEVSPERPQGPQARGYQPDDPLSSSEKGTEKTEAHPIADEDEELAEILGELGGGR
ncbi:DNA primase family protein [Gimesia maris]|uniref:DNA primase family protein n=1 Tax=Gimesia maris TaxID=122 RepID=UPI00241DBBFA|nr:phage/plasmid primase, P4 family [Gimesia maris]|tara:strand:+ start:128510 stop:129745 length:1236 start_codon:yes stop_codon:yes gene_type:complete